MKKLLLPSLLLAALLVSLGTGWTQSRRARANKEFMREKLEHAQKIMEGISIEDFVLIREQAKKLGAMSQAASWQVFENPDYVEYSNSFRRQTEALAKAAKDRNMDGTTLAFMQVTMSCVECHKFVRGKLVASAH